MTTSRRNTIMLWMAYTEFFYPGCELQPGYFYLSIPELYYIPEDGACIGAAGVDAYDLASAWRRVDAPSCPKSDDEYWVHTLQTVFTELEALGLSEAVPKPEPKKRGRKPKAKEGQTPKRPRGRPRKNEDHSAELL